MLHCITIFVHIGTACDVAVPHYSVQVSKIACDRIIFMITTLFPPLRNSSREISPWWKKYLSWNTSPTVIRVERYEKGSGRVLDGDVGEMRRTRHNEGWLGVANFTSGGHYCEVIVWRIQSRLPDFDLTAPAGPNPLPFAFAPVWLENPATPPAKSTSRPE